MRKQWVFLIKLGLLFTILIVKCCEPADHIHDAETNESGPLVLLVSLDGFSQDYLHRFQTPTLDSLSRAGVNSEALIPVFPTKTFPNHYTQITGLYPSNHGIISNRMYDAEFDEYFAIGSLSTAVRDGKWYQGEPVWVTAKRQNLVTATMFWPGSDAQILEILPDYFFSFNGEIPETARISQVLDWIGMKPNPPNLITLYFEQVDHAGHLQGPNSSAVEEAVVSIDKHLNSLMRGLSQIDIVDRLNIIIVSDHGMAQMRRDQVIFIDDYISLDQVEVVNWSPVLEIIPLPGREELVFNQLNGAHQHLQVYRKGSMPAYWNFDNHPRITPIIGVADPGWSVSSKAYFAEHPNAYTGGAHGYDPLTPSMQGIFIAAGPAFIPGTGIGPVGSIHLYQLLCELLEISPAPNDGRLEVWNNILQ